MGEMLAFPPPQDCNRITTGYQQSFNRIATGLLIIRSKRPDASVNHTFGMVCNKANGHIVVY
jgi:hypothetical protein